jgi:hypothetical protein
MPWAATQHEVPFGLPRICARIWDSGSRLATDLDLLTEDLRPRQPGPHWLFLIWYGIGSRLDTKS